ncbi:DKNYY domain-containing protein [Flavobacterium hungaricum]|nr:DKNYY domain-containing protein [Flavobacterium hungaricum]
MQFDLKDSIKLTHIKNQFYRSETGHLYEKTIAAKEIKNKLTDFTYFNGSLFQQIDPITFRPLDGWYAKDQNYVYFYRPTSGGMQLSKINNADPKTFKLLSGHYRYAKDKNYFYDESEVISGFTPSKTNLKLDRKKRVSEMSCDTKKFKFEVVD